MTDKSLLILTALLVVIGGAIGLKILAYSAFFGATGIAITMAYFIVLIATVMVLLAYIEHHRY